MQYKDICKTLMTEEVSLPPAHQSWHEFMRVFEIYDPSDFAIDYMDFTSIESMLSYYGDGVKEALDNSGAKLLEAITGYCTIEYSEAVIRLAPLVY